MRAKIQSPQEVQRWFQAQAASLVPAGLGSLSLRHGPCANKNCKACLSGKKHGSYALYSRHQGRRYSIYVPEELVPEVRQCLENGRALQELMVEAAIRYTKAIRQERRMRAGKE